MHEVVCPSVEEWLEVLSKCAAFHIHAAEKGAMTHHREYQVTPSVCVCAHTAHLFTRDRTSWTMKSEWFSPTSTLSSLTSHGISRCVLAGLW